MKVNGVALGTALLVVVGCNGPELQPWHTERLKAEFTAAMADQVRTFEDYQRLEDELYEQLEEQVYARTETGPEYDLIRYSPGSAADPRGREPNWNRSFELPAESPAGGVLLLHGMSDSPYSLRAVGEALNRHGYWVVGLRLPGHGTAPSGLRYVRSADMTAAVRLAMEHLASELGPELLHVVGYSTGATLALEYALDALGEGALPVPASLVLISPAVGVHSAAALSGFKDGLAAIPGLGRLAWLQVRVEFDPYKYNSFATNAGSIVHRLTRDVRQRIAARAASHPTEVLPPVLVLKSTVDSTVSNDAIIEDLLGRLSPDRHELVLFDTNRLAAKSVLLVRDHGSLTDRLMGDATQPFAVTLITNESTESTRVVAQRKPPFSAQVSVVEPLDLAWPTGVVSLSHVALPVPPNDPLYGQLPPGNEDVLFLGHMAFQGENGMLRISSDWLLRLRYNPFYAVLENRVLDWVDTAGAQPWNSEANRD